MDPVKISGDEIEVDWDALKDMSNNTETPSFKCKKCGTSFFNKNKFSKNSPSISPVKTVSWLTLRRP